MTLPGARSLRMQVSVDGERWQVVRQGINYFRDSFTGRPLVHFPSGEAVARYVRISLQETAPLHLAQVLHSAHRGHDLT